MKNITKRIVTFLLVVSMMFTTSSIALGADQSFNRAPQEEVINGQLYIDGIPYYEQEDIIAQDNANELVSLQDINNISPMASTDWRYIGYTTYYTSRDYDRFENHSSTRVYTVLETSSYTTYQISGDTSAGFKGVAEAKLGVSIGTQWGKKTTHAYNAEPMWKYELKTACCATKHEYNRTTLTGTIKKAYAHGNGGVTRWFYDNPIT